MRAGRSIQCLLFIGSLLFTPLRGQTDDGLFQQFQFNFSPPGARSNAMGRTFIGVANDATAALSNPAGLVNLERTQAYFEFKSIDLRIPRLAAVDSLFTSQPTQFGEDVRLASFLNISTRLGDHVVVAFSRHQFLTLEERFLLQPRAIPDLPLASNPDRFLTFFPSEGNFDLQGVGYAGSVAVEVTEQFSLGLTLSIDRLESKTTETRFDFFPAAVDPNRTSGVRIDDTVVSRSVIRDDDTSLGVIVGALYRQKDRIFSVGAFYSRGARFRLQESFLVNPDVAGDGTELEVADTDGDGVPDFPVTTSIHVPDRLGAGFAFSPTAFADIDSYDLNLVFDVVRVEYSDLLEEFRPIFSAFPVNSARPLRGSDFRIEDVWEVHGGAEFGIGFGPQRRNRLFLRGGVFTNPDHRQRYVGNTGDGVTDSVFRNIFDFPEEDEIGWSAGLGIAISPRVQVDVAYVDINSFAELVASIGFRFWR